MLSTAKRLLRQILETLRPEIEAGTPLVGMEPSCVAVFRDELLNLFPNDENARRLSKQTMLLPEFLATHAPGYPVPKMGGYAILHGHCHDKAIMKMPGEESLLEKMGIAVKTPDTGCCGMAGSFGFEKEHYEVSIQCAERVLLPEIRQASESVIIVADGFSCREQIKQLTSRTALHIAQVLRLAMENGPEGTVNRLPDQENATAPMTLVREVILGAGIAGAIYYLMRFTYRRFKRRE